MINNSIKEFEKIAPINYILTPKNEFVIDFGQIISGYTEISLKGRKGDKIVVHHKESLDSDGDFSPENDNQTLSYILNGEKEEILKHTSSIMKFRYICLEEFPIENVGDDTSFTAIAVYPESKRAFSFICENEETNQLFRDKLGEQKNNLSDDTSDFEDFYKSLCGISIDREKDPQNKYIIIEPKNDMNLKFSSSALETVCGRLEVNRYINSDGVHYEINIPDGITALLKLPGRRVVEKEGGNYIFICKQ